MQRSQKLMALAVFALCAPVLGAWKGRGQEMPMTVAFSTLVGGAGADDCDAIEVDGAGAVYLGCHSDSDDLPGPGALRPSRGDFDAVVFKLSPDGSRIAYRTQLGGVEWDGVQALAISSGGDVYAVGTTYSTGLETSSGAAQPLHAGGGDDAFVARLDGNGAVVHLTYLGGNGRDDAMGVAVDRIGRVYIVGRTTSTDFPVSDDALQSSPGGGSDAFLTVLDTSGAIVYSSYLGGRADDDAQAIELDIHGNIHVAGATYSTDFPLVGALQQTHGGGRDGFVAILSPLGQALEFTTLLGGSGDDEINSLGLDDSGGVYLAGLTRSDDLVVTPQVFQPALGGGGDAFLVRLEALGTAVSYVTYLGGSGDESRARVAVGMDGTVFLTGATSSDDFPLAAPLHSELGGRSSGWVAVVGSGGSSLNFSTYFGGAGIDAFEGAAAHPDGGVVATGLSGSTDMPIVGGLGLEHAGGRGDIPVVRLDVTRR